MALLLFLLPLMVVVALLVFGELRRNPIFKQHRTGLHGRTFEILKFRTMYVAEDRAEVRAAAAGDPRITKLGRFLRRTSLDELPQLINVLRGDMSLVGPRPHAELHDQLFGELIPTYRDRFLTRPGITGLAQVEGFRGEVASAADLQGRVQRDLDYVHSWSIRSDIDILFRTFLTH